jgi:hypothetical protein
MALEAALNEEEGYLDQLLPICRVCEQTYEEAEETAEVAALRRHGNAELNKRL